MKDKYRLYNDRLFQWPGVCYKILNIVTVSIVLLGLLISSASGPIGVSLAASPLAEDDAYTTDEDTPLNVPAPGVLSNDADSDGDTITAILIAGPVNGALTLNLNGSFAYTPKPDWHGTDSFTYVANDGTANSSAATVTLTVNPVDDMPIALNDDYQVAEDNTLTIAAPGVLSNDVDPEGGTLTAVYNSLPNHGTLTLNADGSFVYTPSTNYHGTDSFTYKALTYRGLDGTAESDIATVTITVNPINDLPVAGNDTYTTSEDAPLIKSTVSEGVLGNDADIDADSLTAIIVTSPAHGALSLNPDGTFTYIPNANFYGTDSFTYKANDGTADSNTATATITITPVNDAPTAVDDSYRIDRNTSLWAAQGVLHNDVDVEGDNMIVMLVTGVTHGTLALYSNGTFAYTPEDGYLGIDTFTYKVNDGTEDSVTATVSLIVNKAPVAGDNAYSLNEDTTLAIAAPGVLNDDADPDGGTLTAVLMSGPDHGTLTLNADGSFVYTPWANYHGLDWFTYKAYDGIEYSEPRTVTITVNSINDVPVASDDSYEVSEDSTLSPQVPGVLGNDWDADGTQMGAYLVSGPSHGSLTLYNNGSFRYVPASNYYGEDSFKYTAGDGSSNSSAATVRIKVNPVNDLPSFKNPSYPSRTEPGKPISFSLSFTDPDPENTHIATIYWGDGAKSYASVSESSGSGTITGEHTYTVPGKYRITTFLIEVDGESVSYQTDEINVTTVSDSDTGSSEGSNGDNSGEATPTPEPTIQPSQAPTGTPSPSPGTDGSVTSTIVWLMLAVFGGLAIIVTGYLVFFRRKS
ncbi:Ig-like domain-containing protein [Methanocella arvoryzae]|uniref:Predicted cell-adhesion protein (Cadherin-like) n=1 Tax=Methanocella arvoryzae (strain DSM 22066 / NBRC 105507 / MRE50) TaxID=351160 RepID=Q0W7J4_METAR|nr:Ig-like domain-containing protein [Methanocella arvoryzae]CAJ35649.1 predicted cell-adhesion protein (cadherin-like) [Methanocella arvoryzae MRE50]